LTAPAAFDADADMWAGGKVLALGLAIVAVILVGMAIESRILTTGGVLVALAGAVALPQLGIIVLAAIGPLKPPGVIPAPGFEVALVGAALLGSLYRLPVDTRRVTVSAALLALSAFVAFAFLSQLPSFLSGYSSRQAHDIGFLFYQLVTGFGTIVVAGLVLRGRSPYPVFVALLGSAILAAALAVTTADGAGGLLANLVAQSDVGSRATGPFGNPNSFGQCMAYAGLLAMLWAALARSTAVRWVLLTAAAVFLYAVAASLSRGAAAALLAGLVAFAFSRSRGTGIVATIAALALVGIGYPLFLQFRLSVDFATPSAAAIAELNSSDAGRLGAVLAGPALFAMSPVFGIGFGQYKYMSGLVSEAGAGLVAHNWYGTVLAELGTVGVVLWALVLITVARWLLRRPSVPRAFGGSMFVAALVGCMFLEPPTAFQTSVIPAVVLTAALVADWTKGQGSVMADPLPVVARRGRAPAVPPHAGQGGR
jgi:O-antigen ligase